ncbi:MAG: CBS domain-containing protein [Rhodobacteraceae bacterium]|nr:CBS domain-containing protein [Paracoccaceae bacterium]
MLVRDILSTKQIAKIISVATTDKISVAAELLSEMRIGAVIVRDKGNEMDGILSERDIVRELGRSGTGCLTQTVSELMTTNVKFCAPTDTTQQVMQMMTDGRFRHMPVMDDGKLVGVISIGDVVAARIKEVQFENDSMADLIAGNI